MADRSDEQGFLSRWARRKDEARRAPAVPEPDTRPQQAGTQPEAAGDHLEPPVELPDVDSLTLESDFTLFLRSGVPEQLRRRALHKLWRLDPVFANLDGLNDYDEDYGLLHKLGSRGGVRTAYRIGEGMPSVELRKALREAVAEDDTKPLADDAAGPGKIEPPRENPGAQADTEPPAAAEAPQQGPAAESQPGQLPGDAAGPGRERPRGAAVARRWGGFRT